VLEHSTHAILEYLKRMQVARKTQALDLRALELRRTPVEVAFMTGLTSLSLENNKIQKLFAGLGCLTLLSELPQLAMMNAGASE
jgi:Leucine-rich repeat (LRR) protein